MSTTPAQTAAFLAARQARLEADVQQRAHARRALLPAVAEVLRREFGATGVWLFGSLAVGRLHADSDVDLAVEGIGGDRIDRAHAAVDAILGTVVDLVALETAAESLRIRVQREGVPL